MKSHRKLLLTGMAIVPLLLSSWTSERNSLNSVNEDANQKSSIEIIGSTAINSSVTERIRTKYTSVEFEEKIIIVQKSATQVSVVAELSFEKIVKDYQ